ncbi:hypothetical protein ARMGADRAFT_1029987 [Armillaria gallica]|uniref:Uncharacterized protein n=1 Tax=Armillaria gallica TaxID=47427 RepID=A0A2H3DJB6_ARMGA|nr:hypothetical protein ARMGADRAFT_1029987 [Armillaria gallica]
MIDLISSSRISEQDACQVADVNKCLLQQNRVHIFQDQSFAELNITMYTHRLLTLQNVQASHLSQVSVAQTGVDLNHMVNSSYTPVIEIQGLDDATKLKFCTNLFPYASAMYTRTVVLFLTTLSTPAAQHTATNIPDAVPGKTTQGHIGTNECGMTSSQDSMFQNLYVTKYGLSLHFIDIFFEDTFCRELSLRGVIYFSASGTDMQGQIFDLLGIIAGSTFFLGACDLAEMMAAEYCHYDQPLNDSLRCEWNIADNYDTGVIESCHGDSGLMHRSLGSFSLVD